MHVAPERHTWSQCKWLLFVPFPRSKAQVRAMNATNWAEVHGDKGLASMVSKLETTAYPALLFPSKTKLLPSVYQISSDWLEDLLTSPLRVLSSNPKFLGKSERGESPWG